MADAYEIPDVSQDDESIDVIAMTLDGTKMRSITIYRDKVIITDTVKNGPSTQEVLEHSAFIDRTGTAS